MSDTTFQQFVPVRGQHPRLGSVDLESHDAYSWADFGLQKPMIQALWDGWQQLFREPFRGITTSGEPEPGLFSLGAEGAPVQDMFDAATVLLQEAEKAQVTEKLRYSLDANEWRSWANPEFYFARHGIRFEETTEPVAVAALALVKASLSLRGYHDVLALMRINGFLGNLVGAPQLMNKQSYNFILFGEPSISEPWGWSLWGHHLTLCMLVLGTQMVVSPVFRGCEPNMVTSGPYAGTEVFAEEMRLAVRMMQLLSDRQRDAAIVYDEVESPDMPEGFPHPADGRNLAGAYEDNKIIPYSGALVSSFSNEAQRTVLALVEKFIDFIPAAPLAFKMKDVRHHLNQTWLMWMGGYGDEEVFHFRIHSPVLLCEFDHECGMWLTNDRPGRFHVHTVVRTPNGNDYGKELIRLQRLEQKAVAKQLPKKL